MLEQALSAVEYMYFCYNFSYEIISYSIRVNSYFAHEFVISIFFDYFCCCSLSNKTKNAKFKLWLTLLEWHCEMLYFYHEDIGIFNAALGIQCHRLFKCLIFSYFIAGWRGPPWFEGRDGIYLKFGHAVAGE